MRRRGGFTFIEITIVIVIMLSLTAVALPRMRSTVLHMRLKQGARDVASALRLARDSAVLRELPVEVRFKMNEDEDDGPDQYQLVLYDESNEAIELRDRRRRQSRRAQENDELRFPGRESLQVRTLPEGIYFSVVGSAAPLTEDGDLPRVVFHPDGSASGATIGLQDLRGRALNVVVYRATGQSRVEAGEPKDVEQSRTLYYGPEGRAERRRKK